MASIERNWFPIYNIFKKIIAIAIVPLLLLSTFSVVILVNSKLHNNIPSLFGNYVLTMPDNNFAIPDSEKWRQGSQELFKTQQTEDYQIGDLIAFYSNTTQDAPINATGPTWNTNDELSSNHNRIVNTSSFDDEETTNTYSFGKIANIGYITLDDTQEHVTIYSIFTSNDDTNDQDSEFVICYDVIGVATSGPGLFISFISFSGTTNGFLTLILIPCLLLLVLISLTDVFGNKYNKTQVLKNKNLFISQESKKEKEFAGAMGGGSGYFSTILQKKTPPSGVPPRAAPPSRTVPSGPPPRMAPPPKAAPSGPPPRTAPPPRKTPPPPPKK